MIFNFLANQANTGSCCKIKNLGLVLKGRKIVLFKVLQYKAHLLSFVIFLVILLAVNAGLYQAVAYLRGQYRFSQESKCSSLS